MTKKLKKKKKAQFKILNVFYKILLIVIILFLIKTLAVYSFPQFDCFPHSKLYINQQHSGSGTGTTASHVNFSGQMNIYPVQSSGELYTA